VLGCGLAEGGLDDLGGDPQMGTDVQGVAGAVIEPADDLDIDAGGEPVVGEVGLLGLVGHRCLEADVGGLRTLLGLGVTSPAWAR
jgi:hypothetical protein